MPVLSPRRSGLSTLSGGPYKSSYSSNLDRPYLSSNYLPKISSYSEHITSRSYVDSDGSRVYVRQGSILEDGITTRFNEETRESSIRRDSVSRDSGISSIRENSVLDMMRRDREESMNGRSEPRHRLSTVNVIESVAELRNKYSPANYVPACLRKNENMARSRSINDIGKPPLERAEPKHNNKVNEADANIYLRVKEFANTTNHEEDDNGNKTPSFAEIKEKFNKGWNAGCEANVKSGDESLDELHVVSNNCFKKQDSKLASGTAIGSPSKRAEDKGSGNRTSDFASYIPTKDFNGHKQASKDDDNVKVTIDGNDMENHNFLTGNGRYFPQGKQDSTEVATSPRLNRALSQGPATSTLSASRSTNDKQTASVHHLGLNGLKNIGNTCFMNSVIQCLSNTRLLLEYVKNDGFMPDINTTISGMKGALIKAFGQVIKELWCEDSSDRVVNTTTLKSQIQRFAPRFMGYSQQDAQEFLRYLLEGLHEDVNRVTSKPAPVLTEIDDKLSDSEKASESWQRYLRMDNSKIVDIFVGQLKSTLKCTHCGHSSVTFDPFWDLSLPIPQRAGPLRLQQCLDHFTREETLDGDEKPTCSKCKERRKCTKSFTIQKFPKILVIHLKRFSPTERYRGKLSVTVDFPLEGLDLRNYAAESSPSECRYNLYAISNHSGTTYSGHYTAYCRHPYSLTWHEYNDSRVSSISSKSIVSGEAYVLFYELDGLRGRL